MNPSFVLLFTRRCMRTLVQKIRYQAKIIIILYIYLLCQINLSQIHFLPLKVRFHKQIKNR